MLILWAKETLNTQHITYRHYLQICEEQLGQKFPSAKSPWVNPAVAISVQNSPS